MPEPIVFSGIAQLRQRLAGPLPCELRGSAAAPENLPLLLRFALRGTVTLPAQLQDARLDCTGPDACGLSARNLPQAVPVSWVTSALGRQPRRWGSSPSRWCASSGARRRR